MDTSGGISDDFMKEMLRKTRRYTLVVLHATPKRHGPGADAIVWEHGRRNFELRRDGLLRIVCPVVEKGSIAGICIFASDLDETRRVMDGDPAVEAGILTYETHSIAVFPKDSL